MTSDNPQPVSKRIKLFIALQVVAWVAVSLVIINMLGPIEISLQDLHLPVIIPQHRNTLEYNGYLMDFPDWVEGEVHGIRGDYQFYYSGILTFRTDKVVVRLTPQLSEPPSEIYSYTDLHDMSTFRLYEASFTNRKWCPEYDDDAGECYRVLLSQTEVQNGPTEYWPEYLPLLGYDQVKVEARRLNRQDASVFSDEEYWHIETILNAVKAAAVVGNPIQQLLPISPTVEQIIASYVAIYSEEPISPSPEQMDWLVANEHYDIAALGVKICAHADPCLAIPYKHDRYIPLPDYLVLMGFRSASTLSYGGSLVRWENKGLGIGCVAKYSSYGTEVYNSNDRPDSFMCGQISEYLLSSIYKDLSWQETTDCGLQDYHSDLFPRFSFKYDSCKWSIDEISGQRIGPAANLLYATEIVLSAANNNKLIIQLIPLVGLEDNMQVSSNESIKVADGFWRVKEEGPHFEYYDYSYWTSITSKFTACEVVLSSEQYCGSEVLGKTITDYTTEDYVSTGQLRLSPQLGYQKYLQAAVQAKLILFQNSSAEIQQADEIIKNLRLY